MFRTNKVFSAQSALTPREQLVQNQYSRVINGVTFIDAIALEHSIDKDGV